jgi:hydroxyacylglutathione hydrolase
MFAWETDGRPYDHIPTIFSGDLLKELKKGSDLTVLDVRKKEEWDEDHLKEAVHIYLGRLPDELEKLDKNKTVVTLCGSGRRAVIAASLLRGRGFSRVMDALGAMQAVD